MLWRGVAAVGAAPITVRLAAAPSRDREATGRRKERAAALPREMGTGVGMRPASAAARRPEATAHGQGMAPMGARPQAVADRGRRLATMAQRLMAAPLIMAATTLARPIH